MGVPLHQLWEDAGYSQTQIARFRELLIDERALLRVPFLSDAGACTARPRRRPADAAA